MSPSKRNLVAVGDHVLSPESFRMGAFMLFGALIAICVILTMAFTEIPADTELIRAFGYNNICVYIDDLPAWASLLNSFKFVPSC